MRTRVLIAPSSPAAAATRDQLSRWAESGIVRPFIWWDLADPPERVDVIGRNGHATSMGLAQALGEAGPEHVRFVAVGAFTNSEEAPEGFPDAIRARLAVARSVLAFDEAHPAQATMVVVPSALRADVPKGWFATDWAANIYIAPEDRRAPDEPNQLVGAGTDDVARHTAHAVASFADLLVTADGEDHESVLDTLGAKYVNADDPISVFVARCYSRVIDHGFLPDHVLSTVLHRKDGWPNPDTERFDRGDAAEAQIKYLSQAFLMHHRDVLGLSRFEPLTVERPPLPGLMEALRRLVRMLFGRIRSLPERVIEDAKARVHDKAAGLIEKAAGPNSGLRVRRYRDGQVDASLGELLKEGLDAPLPVKDPPVGDTWRGFVALHLALVDGSDLPPGIDVASITYADKRLVITDPKLVANDPRDRAPIDWRPTRGTCDPLVHESTLAESGRSLLSLEPLTPEPAENDVAEHAAWVGRAASSLSWRIGREVGGALAQAHAATVVDLEAEAAADATADAEREKTAMAAASSRRRALTTGVLLRVAAWLLVIVALAAAVSITAAALGAVVGVPLLLLSLAFLARARIGRDETLEWEQLEIEVQRLNRDLERQLRRRDVELLTRRYDEFVDFAEVVGHLVHRPFLGATATPTRSPSVLDPSDVPAAMDLSVARTESRLARIAAVVGRDVFRPGWLTGVCGSVVDQALASRAARLGLSNTGGQEVYGDLSRDADSPRRSLCREVRAGNGRRIDQVDRNPLTRTLLASFETLALDAVSDGLVRADPAGARPLGPSVGWFEEPLGLPDLVERLRPSVVRLRVVRATGETSIGTGALLEGGELIATAGHAVANGTDITVTFSDGTSRKASVERSASSTDLALLRLAVTKGEEAPALPLGLSIVSDGENPGVGEPLVTLGYPLDLDGPATMGWGLVTAIDRTIEIAVGPGETMRVAVLQASYQGAGGASGSPVADLNGRIVGVHCAGEVTANGNARAASMSFAVPASELRLLIAGAEGEAPHPTATANEQVLESRPGHPATSTQVLAQLAGPAGEERFLADHWAQHPSADAQAVHETRIAGVVTSPSVTIVEVAGPVRFQTPLRVLARRIELTRATPSRTIAGNDA
jgi:S1-C subfamily serine protease